MGRQGTKILAEDWLKRWTLLAGGQKELGGREPRSWK